MNQLIEFHSYTCHCWCLKVTGLDRIDLVKQMPETTKITDCTTFEVNFSRHKLPHKIVINKRWKKGKK